MVFSYVLPVDLLLSRPASSRTFLLSNVNVVPHESPTCVMYPTLIGQHFAFIVHLSRLLPPAFGRRYCCVRASCAFSPLLNPRILHRRVIIPDGTYGS